MPTSTAFNNLMTFSRASQAMLTSSLGYLTYAPNNLLTYSEQFDNSAWGKSAATVTPNATTAPDGTTTADKLVESSDASPTLHVINRSGLITTAGNYTLSIYAKAAERSQLAIQFGANVAYFDLTLGTVVSGTGIITAAGSGWYRCSITATIALTNTTVAYYTAVGGTATYTGDGTSGVYLWGAQLETGSFATSYIPTVASQVTRSADFATMTGSNFSQWYNQSEGTFVVEADSVGFTSAGAIIYGRGGIGTDDITMRFLPGNFVNGAVSLAGGVTQANLTASGSYPANGTLVKFAMAVKVNDFAASANGSVVVTDTSGSVPVLDRMTLGVGANLAQSLNGHIRNIRYYNTRLPNIQLRTLTM